MRLVWRRRWFFPALAVAAAVLAGAMANGGAKPAANDFHFAILGDRTGSAQPGIYGRVWREVSLLHPAFAINVGDTIDSATIPAAEAEWRKLHQLWTRYGKTPLFLVPGNHDMFSEAARALFERESGHPATYGFDWQGGHFTVLDNSAELELSEEQLDFLARDLEEHRNADPKFVFFHKPFWLIPLKLGSGEFKLHQLAVKYGVRAVVSGHGHQLIRMARDGVTYLEVGSSGANFHSMAGGDGFQEGWFYHFVWVAVAGSKVSMTVKELSAPAGNGRMFPIEEWGEPGPKFNAADPATDPET
jgi:hypothetical protein